MSAPLGIALLGCGTVGAGVARLLMHHADRLGLRAGRELQLRHVVVRDVAKARATDLPAAVVTTDLQRVLADPSVDVVCELVGGTDWAWSAARASLEAGKHLVTANKSLLATRGRELFALARDRGRCVGFEASVAGGVPIIGAITQGLAGNGIESIQGILNGTTNFILSAMSDQGSDYAASLAEAQRLGFAEADPTLDVDGSDAMHKLVILTRLAFGCWIEPDMIERRGVTDVTATDVRCAAELGYVIKLIAEARRQGDAVAVRVGPMLVRRGSPLAEVRGGNNAIQVIGDAVGAVTLTGPGAGMMPTASAVVADLIDIAVGRAQSTFAALGLWAAVPNAPSVDMSESQVCRQYVRLNVADRPGVLAEAATLLAIEGISIASVIQHEAPQKGTPADVGMVIMTHPTSAGSLRRALERINQSNSIREPATTMPIAEVE